MDVELVQYLALGSSARLVMILTSVRVAFITRQTINIASTGKINVFFYTFDLKFLNFQLNFCFVLNGFSRSIFKILINRIMQIKLNDKNKH